MSRALLRRLLPLSPTVAGSSSYGPRRVPSSRYAPASTAAQADAAAQAGAAAAEPAAGGEQGASAPPPEARGRWGLLKFGALAAFSAALGGLGYVSFAYSLDEVEQKARELRKKQAATVPGDASGVEKFKAMAMKGTDFSVLLIFIARILYLYLYLESRYTSQPLV